MKYNNKKLINYLTINLLNNKDRNCSNTTHGKEGGTALLTWSNNQLINKGDLKKHASNRLVKLIIKNYYYDHEIVNYFGNTSTAINNDLIISIVILRKKGSYNLNKVLNSNNAKLYSKNNNQNLIDPNHFNGNNLLYPLGIVKGCFRFKTELDTSHLCPSKWFANCKKIDGTWI